MNKSIIFLFLLLPIYLSIGGCLTTISAYPEPYIGEKTEMENIEKLEEYLGVDVIKKYYPKMDIERNGMTKKEWRKAVVNARLRGIDVRFYEYQKDLLKEGIGLGIISDWAVLGLGGLGSVLKSSSRALSAASAGVQGAKASFDKQAYFNKTLPILISTMEANRKKVLAEIRENLKKPVSDYDLMVALGDVDSYKQAGSINGAIIDVAADAGEKEKEADKSLQEIYLVKPVSKALQSKREKAADFIRSAAKNDKNDKDCTLELQALAESLDLPVDSNGNGKQLSLAIREKISLADSEPGVDHIVQKIKIIFGDDTGQANGKNSKCQGFKDTD